MLQTYPVEVVRFQSVITYSVPAFSQEDAVERMKAVSANVLDLQVVRAPSPGSGRRDDTPEKP